MSATGKTTPALAIELMVQSINTNDRASFYRVVENYRNGLPVSGEIYPRITRLLNNKPKSFTLLDTINGKVKGLVEQAVVGEENVYTNPAVEAFVTTLLTEWRHRDLYNYHNLGVRTKLLLHGPTGNGKTTLVRHIARLSGLPLVEVKADSVIDSHMGCTGANIEKIFSNIKEPSILFWDEVDGVGRRRGGANRGSGTEVENDRMVNSMLLNLDKLDQSVIFIGATNRRDILDAALLRRFDIQFELPNPCQEEKAAFASQLMAYHNLPASLIGGEVSSLVNFSEVKGAVLEAARRYIANTIIKQEGANI